MSNDENTAKQEPHVSDAEAQDENIEYEPFSDTIDTSGMNSEEFDASQYTDQENELMNRIQALEEELAGSKDKMVRAVAEAENTRRRAQKDREDASRFAIAGFSRDLVSVADNLRRALDAVAPELLEAQPEIKNLTDGIEATERELLRSFAKNGITKIEPLDEQFDPNFHEVMFEAPMPDKPNGSIIQVIEAGYVLHGRILRPARVGVAKSDIVGGDAASGPGQTIDTQA